MIRIYADLDGFLSAVWSVWIPSKVLAGEIETQGRVFTHQNHGAEYIARF